MRPVYTRTVAPVAAPVTLEQVKAHLRVDHSAEDALLGVLIGAAVSHLDGRDGALGRALMAQTWAASFDAPDCHGGFVVELGGITDVTTVERLVGGSYVAVDAADWSWARLSESRAQVRALNAWPGDAACGPAAWRVTFTAGADAAADVPPAIVAALLLLVGDLYRNRETKVAGGVTDNPTFERLLAPYRILWG